MAKKKKDTVESFANKAYRNGSTYAEEQKKESCELAEKIKIPKGYTKISERRK